MKKNKKLAKVYHYDLYGKRDEKYKFLDEKSVNNIEWNELEYNEPYYFFVSKDFEDIKSYNSGFNVSEIFNDYNSGIQTKNDSITVHFNESSLNKIINDFSNLSVEELKEKYLIKDGVWKTVEAKKDILEKSYKMTKVLYKLFDYRYTILTRRSGGFIGRPRGKVMLDMTNSNIGLCLMRTTVDSKTYSNIFLSEIPIDLNLYGFQTFIFPLYLYPEAGEQATLDQSSSEPTTPSFGHPSTGEELGRKPNLDMKLVAEIAKGLGLEFRDVAPWDSTTPSFGHPSYRRGISNIFHHFISHLWKGVRRTGLSRYKREWSYATITHHSTPTLSTSFISLSVSVRATIIFW